MRTGLKISGILTVFFGFGLSACNSETLETEMQRWCECEQQAKRDAAPNDECNVMMTKIARRYEFDPEAAQKIRTLVAECR